MRFYWLFFALRSVVECMLGPGLMQKGCYVNIVATVNGIIFFLLSVKVTSLPKFWNFPCGPNYLNRFMAQVSSPVTIFGNFTLHLKSELLLFKGWGEITQACLCKVQLGNSLYCTLIFFVSSLEYIHRYNIFFLKGNLNILKFFLQYLITADEKS